MLWPFRWGAYNLQSTSATLVEQPGSVYKTNTKQSINKNTNYLHQNPSFVSSTWSLSSSETQTSLGYFHHINGLSTSVPYLPSQSARNHVTLIWYSDFPSVLVKSGKCWWRMRRFCEQYGGTTKCLHPFHAFWDSQCADERRRSVGYRPVARHYRRRRPCTLAHSKLFLNMS